MANQVGFSRHLSLSQKGGKTNVSSLTAKEIWSEEKFLAVENNFLTQAMKKNLSVSLYEHYEAKTMMVNYFFSISFLLTFGKDGGGKGKSC